MEPAYPATSPDNPGRPALGTLACVTPTGVAGGRRGYRAVMSHPYEERPVDVPDDVVEEEDVDTADTADRVEKDPEEQVNYTERHGVDADRFEDPENAPGT